MSIETVVIPAAGLGTRLLPATRSVPKELLPVYDTPLLQFALNEAIHAGATRIVVVSHRSKDAIGDYLQPATDLEQTLQDKGKLAELTSLRRVSLPDTVTTAVVYQDQPLGLGHAVLQAADHIRGDAFGVILPDDLLLDGTCLQDMARAYLSTAATSLVAAVEVPQQDVNKYGIFRADDTRGRTVPARGLVEKPAPDTAPSRLAAIGRYILSAKIFDALKTTKPGAGGEIQLTDAIDAMGGLHGYRVDEPRYDCGSTEGLFAAGSAVRHSRMNRRASLKIAAE